MYIEPVINRLPVPMNGVLAHVEPRRNLLFEQTIEQQRQNLLPNRPKTRGTDPYQLVSSIMIEPRSNTDGPTTTSTSLILRIQAQDSAAWERFARLYGPLLYSWCRGSGLQPSDAEDVSQDAFRSVMAGIGSYERTGPFRGWLWTVTHNKVRDHFRHRQRQAQGVGGSDFVQRLAEIPERPPDSESSVHVTGDPVLLRALEMIRAEFEESTWTAFWRMVVEGKTAAEIAADLGWAGPDKADVAKGAKRVRQAKLRVMKRLREEFGDVLDLP